jgi:hypothetical protein
LGSFLAATALCLAEAAPGGAAERDLRSGVAYLRAGAQLEAEQLLMKYRDEEPDAAIRRNVDRVLPLLRQPLTPELREYIAGTLEETVRSGQMSGAPGPRPGYALRMFPVFP